MIREFKIGDKVKRKKEYSSLRFKEKLLIIENIYIDLENEEFEISFKDFSGQWDITKFELIKKKSKLPKWF